MFIWPHCFATNKMIITARNYFSVTVQASPTMAMTKIEYELNFKWNGDMIDAKSDKPSFARLQPLRMEAPIVLFVVMPQNHLECVSERGQFVCFRPRWSKPCKWRLEAHQKCHHSITCIWCINHLNQFLPEFSLALQFQFRSTGQHRLFKLRHYVDERSKL